MALVFMIYDTDIGEIVYATFRTYMAYISNKKAAMHQLDMI